MEPPVALRLPKELHVKIDAWRRRQPDLPGKQEAIRRLIDAGLKASRSGK